MDGVTPGWRSLHIGTEGDAVAAEGVSLWQPEWVSLGDRIVVAHPTQSRDQRHPAWTYQVAADGRVVEFAAGELSNGVWGFFVRTPA